MRQRAGGMRRVVGRVGCNGVETGPERSGGIDRGGGPQDLAQAKDGGEHDWQCLKAAMQANSETRPAGTGMGDAEPGMPASMAIQERMAQLQREHSAYRRIDHPNVVAFLGPHWDENRLRRVQGIVLTPGWREGRIPEGGDRPVDRAWGPCTGPKRASRAPLSCSSGTEGGAGSPCAPGQATARCRSCSSRPLCSCSRAWGSKHAAQTLSLIGWIPR